LPGTPSEETLDLVRRSAQMRFRPVLVSGGPGVIDPVALAAEDEGFELPGEGDAGEEPAPEEVPEEEAAPEDEAAPEATAGDEAAGDEATGDEAAAEDDAGTGGAVEEDVPTEETPEDATPEQIEAAASYVADTDGDGELSAEPLTEDPPNNSDLAWVTEQAAYDFYTLNCADPSNLSGGQQNEPDQPVAACSVDGSAKYILGPTDVEGTHVAGASSGLGQTPSGATTGEWVVNIDLDGEGTRQFADVSERLFSLEPPRNQFAMVLDGLVVSAPQMNAVISDGNAVISGSFTRESAAALSNQLNFGSLPLNFQVQSEEQISATLGTEQLRNGILAGALGLGLVALYLLWQYRGLAMVAISSLLVAAVLTYGLIALLSWTANYRLSLAGVAGLVIAIGITADSFILYFERLRDEVRDGASLESAVHLGWSRARRTIIVSDLVTLLAAVVLYFLAVGGVRGFAFTLGLTTLIDLVVVFMFTHPLMQLLVRTRFFGEGHRLSGLNAANVGATGATYRGRGRVARPEPVSTTAPAGSRRVPAGTADGPRLSIAERRAAERRREQEAAAAEEGGAGPPMPGADGRSDSHTIDTSTGGER
ncbi:protein translocase subunit SecD, partial [Georgenia sp. 10Sc9-8]|nr:protein translocase subunit SecD [Georgenia halotolerans]